MKAETLEALMSLMRRKWVTPLIALHEADCLSLSQRAGDLKGKKRCLLKPGEMVISKNVKTTTGKWVVAHRIVKAKELEAA